MFLNEKENVEFIRHKFIFENSEDMLIAKYKKNA